MKVVDAHATHPREAASQVDALIAPRERLTAGRLAASSAKIFLDGVLDFVVLDRDFFEIPPRDRRPNATDRSRAGSCRIGASGPFRAADTLAAARTDQRSNQ